MAKLKITKGLDVPIKGAPTGPVQPLLVDGRPAKPKEIALDFSPFLMIKPKLLKKAGEMVKVGEPLVAGKQVPGRMFVSPASGVIKEVHRGLKRRLLSIVIEVSENEEFKEFPQEDPADLSREHLTELLMEGGIFAHIRRRPFDLLADPHQTPRAIFVSAVETAPFQPSAEMQVEGFEEEFAVGLEALKKLTDGPVHLVYPEKSDFKPFTEAAVETHTIEGPHPAGNHSVHIQMLSPIQSVEENIWTLRALDVVCIGHLLKQGRIHTDRVVSIAGPGVLDGAAGYFRTRAGAPVSSLIAGRVEKGAMRFVSGDLLMGSKVDAEGFLGFYDTQLSVVPESTHREMLHFFRLGIDKYSASRTYLSGFLSDRIYDFNTSNHGEHRAFVIAKPYDAVMPMNIPTMQLVKAVMAEDFDLAEELGFLEVAPEDFALATFVCPSKMEMIGIIEKGLKEYAVDVLH